MQSDNSTTPGNAPGARPSLAEEGTDPSWQTRAITCLLRRLPIKKKTASANAVLDEVRKLALRPASHRPPALGPDVAVAREDWAGWPVYRTSPGDDARARDFVVFLHGGGYIHEIVRAHWKFVAFLTRLAKVRCVVPIYPLAPQATAKDVVPGTGQRLRKLLDEAGDARVTVIGNSAGAGLALAAAQWLRDNGYRQPDKLVLISPGLDATLSHPEQPALARQDPLQDIPGIHQAGRLYAGELGLAHPYVSPLRGDMHGLAPMLVFAGTLDLLYPDSVALAAKARAAGVPVDLHVQRGQPHNYPGLPTPEGRAAREAILHAVMPSS